MRNPTQNFPMSKLTTLNIGGTAKYFYEAQTEGDLWWISEWAMSHGLNYRVIGGGSNLLVSDKGVDELIIKNSIRDIKLNQQTVIVKSGTILQDLVNFTIEQGLSGLQMLTGIPGTVGGAIYGNAGAYGQTISDHLTSVTLSERGEPKDSKTFSKSDCHFGYRDAIFKKNRAVILEAVFELTTGDIPDLKRQALETIKAREVKYPPGIKCPGSFFKNLVAEELTAQQLSKIPKEKIVYGKVPAGSLLEEVGAKGMRQGQIEVAPYHANLFINQGGGKAEDFYKLAKKLSDRVEEKFGIKLEPEVQLINLPPL